MGVQHYQQNAIDAELKKALQNPRDFILFESDNDAEQDFFQLAYYREIILDLKTNMLRKAFPEEYYGLKKLEKRIMRNFLRAITNNWQPILAIILLLWLALILMAY